MKKISVVIPTYNEEENVELLLQAIKKELNTGVCTEEKEYDYEIIFIDNNSSDSTQEKIRKLCSEDKRVKAIFNTKNFGQFNSPYYGMLQSSGDCTILMCADFQDPVDMIGKFIRTWEEGYKIAVGVKVKSKENPLMYFLRSCYYKLIRKMSDKEQIEHFTGFGLYDREFIEILRRLDDPKPYLRGIVAELGFKRKEIPYEQQKRKAGKTKNNFFRLYDAAMLGLTSYTRTGIRIATFLGMIFSFLSILIAFFYLVVKLVCWDMFSMGMAPVLIGVFVLGSLQLMFIGILGEYILSINERVLHRPLVVEEERVNFDN